MKDSRLENKGVGTGEGEDVPRIQRTLCGWDAGSVPEPNDQTREAKVVELKLRMGPLVLTGR